MSTNSDMVTQTSLKQWKIQSADQLSCCGDRISTSDFNATSWVEAQVPCTVLATLVAAGEHKEPYYEMNLKDIPRNRFQQSWWYRNEFQLDKAKRQGTTLLEFDGINYAANIWLNGTQIADSDQCHGAFQQFSFDISEWVKKGNNTLAIEVIPPEPGDFSIGFVDWNPPAPDRNMGIFRPVRLHHCRNISIQNPFIKTDLDIDTLDHVSITISAELKNHNDQPATCTLKGQLESILIEKKITLAPQEKKTVTLISEINHPRIWWPHDLGDPNLYGIHLEVALEGEICDSSQATFGIRHIEDYFNPQGHRGYKINGTKVLIKSGGWTDDLLLADTPKKLEAQIQYVKHMNLNSVRLEGFWGTDHTLYDLCDRYGILMMVGWSCHWEHEQYLEKPIDERFGGITVADDIDLIAKSFTAQVIWLRNHPSVFVWTLGSDKIPHPDLETKFVETFEKYDPTRPYLASTGGVGSEQAIIGSEEIISDISGPTGVKMLGPYAYTPPVYWHEDQTRGGAYGFNTETGPGAQVPVLESIKKMMGKKHLWPIDDCWEFHCGLNEFSTLDRYCHALANRYGPVENVEQFSYRGQVMNYELIRPMFEAFRINKGLATGVVQWMLNAAWPKMYWQLYDWYLNPTGAFYGTRKACEPLQLVYNYSTQKVFLVNDTLSNRNNLTAEIRILDLQANEIFSSTQTVNSDPRFSMEVISLPDLTEITATYFLDLKLYEEDRAPIASNFYWLSTRPDILDSEAKVEPWEFYTPSKEYADFTQLNKLAPATLTIRHQLRTNRNNNTLSVNMENTGNSIAFAVELNILDKQTGHAILPVFWQDNYITLLPGEKRNVSAEFAGDDSMISLEVAGWNLDIERFAI